MYSGLAQLKMYVIPSEVEGSPRTGSMRTDGRPSATLGMTQTFNRTQI
jgi:hypothetical protein